VFSVNLNKIIIHKVSLKLRLKKEKPHKIGVFLNLNIALKRSLKKERDPLITI